MICCGCLQLEFDNLLDLLQFVLNISFSGSFEDMLCFFFATDLHEPAWTFWEEINANANNDDEDDLESKRCAPCHGLVVVEVCEVFNPVSQSETTNVLILVSQIRKVEGSCLTMKNSIARKAPLAEWLDTSADQTGMTQSIAPTPTPAMTRATFRSQRRSSWVKYQKNETSLVSRGILWLPKGGVSPE